MAGEHITIRTTDGSIRPISPLRGADGSTLSEGGSNYDVIDRPKRYAFTRWTGSAPFRMSVPVLFEGWQDGDSQEDAITRLIRMSLPPKEHEAPPMVKVSGGTPGDRYTWVIDDIEWGTNVIWGFKGGVAVRFRQDATIHLLQFIGEDVLGKKKPATRQAKARTYVVKKGDTLGGIAVKMYGDRNKWKVIAKANNIRDPKDIHVGQRLRIP